MENAVCRKEKSPIRPVLALPVVDAAVGRIVRFVIVVNPQLLARCCVQRHHIIVLAEDVHHVVDDHGVEAETKSIVARKVEPHLL
jgi:hypothetical protein